MKNIILIGFMGSGKSTIGRALAAEYNIKQIDTDYSIEKRAGRKISEIFELYGEEAFRQMETDFITEISGNKHKHYVISVGGGLPVREINRRILKKSGVVVYLKAEVETLEARLSGDKKRPLLQNGDLREKIVSLMAEREHIYEELADIIISTDKKQITDVVREIKKGILL